MRAFWTVCQTVAVALILGVIVGSAQGSSASDFADGVLTMLRAGLIFVGAVVCIACVVLMAEMFVDAWRDR